MAATSSRCPSADVVAVATAALIVATTSGRLAAKPLLTRKNEFCALTETSTGKARAFCFSSAIARNGSQIDHASTARRAKAAAASAGAR
jgi:hypothetical protein